MSSSHLCDLKSFQHVDDIVSSYDTDLRNLIDKHAVTATTKLVTLHPESPWFNIEIDKKERCRAEKARKKLKLTI